MRQELLKLLETHGRDEIQRNVKLWSERRELWLLSWRHWWHYEARVEGCTEACVLCEQR